MRGINQMVVQASVGLESKLLEEPQLLYFGIENFCEQFRFQNQSFRFHLIWNWNSIEMEPNQYQNGKNANSF